MYASLPYSIFYPNGTSVNNFANSSLSFDKIESAISDLRVHLNLSHCCFSHSNINYHLVSIFKVIRLTICAFITSFLFAIMWRYLYSQLRQIA
jgi:hypothetical protein